MAFTHGYALLIGVNENDVPRWALPAVAKDINALTDVLKHPDRCAYLQENMLILKDGNATGKKILAGLTWLKEKLEKDPDSNTTALIYYSGHGVQDNSQSPPAYYLLPCDVSKNKALLANDFAAQIAAFAPRRLLVLLDCCHSEGMGIKDIQATNLVPFTIHPALFIGKQKSLPIESGGKGIDTTLLAKGSGRVVLNSSRSDEKSYIRRDGKMSIFTYHLIEALTGYAPHHPDDKEVTVADVLSHVWKTVPTSAQKDWQSPQHPDGQLSGNFPIAMLLGGEGVPKGKSPPDPLDELPDEGKTAPQSDFNQPGQTVNGPQTNINGNVGTLISGNPKKVHIDQRKIRVGGDYVERDKIDNSVHVEDVTNSPGVAIGPNARQTTGADLEAITKVFATLQQRVNQLQDKTKKEDAGDALKKLEAEAKKGEHPNENRVLHLLKFLAGMSKDVFDVAVAAFIDPLNGLSTAFSKIAQHAKEEQEGG